LRTLVIGDLNVDIIASGIEGLPILGHEIFCRDIRTLMGGSASIFACRLAQLGAEVDIMGKGGRDHHGRIVLENLRSSGVGLGRVIIEDDVRTGVTISLTYPENKALITFPGSIDSLEEKDINPDVFNNYNHLHISSIYIQRRLLPSVPKILEEAKSRGLITSLDTQADPLNRYEYIWEILDYVDIFLPNDAEAKGITGSGDLAEALDRLSSKVGVVVIKCGERGAIGKSEGRVVRVKPIRIKPIDTTGAGDSFDAGFIYYYLHRGMGFEESVRFANALGALSCLYIGGADRKINELEVLKFLKNHQPEVVNKG